MACRDALKIWKLCDRCCGKYYEFDHCCENKNNNCCKFKRRDENIKIMWQTNMTNLIILMKIKTKVIAWDISGELSHCKDGFRANKANLISLRKIRMIVAILRVALKIWKSCCRQIWQRWYYHWLRRTNLVSFHIAKLSSGVQVREILYRFVQILLWWEFSFFFKTWNISKCFQYSRQHQIIGHREHDEDTKFIQVFVIVILWELCFWCGSVSGIFETKPTYRYREQVEQNKFVHCPLTDIIMFLCKYESAN